MLYAVVRKSITFPFWQPPLQTVRKMASIIRPPRDPNTLSNYNNFLTTKTVANLEINFETKSISGNVNLELTSITEAESQEMFVVYFSQSLSMKTMLMRLEPVDV